LRLEHSAKLGGQGRLDAAFLRTAVRDLPHLLVDDILDEPMIAALPAGHRVAREGEAPLRLSRLAEEPFILYRRPTGPGLHDAIVAACRSAGFSPNVVQEAPRLTATLSLVAAGLGLSVVPASMRSLAIPGVVYRPRKAPRPDASRHLATRREEHAAVLARFRELVGRMRTVQASGPKP
jgi:DNA-binding transcriptional LysR family regulator